MATKKPIKKSALDLVSLYEQMLQIRRFEERAAQLYGMGHIMGFCHLYIGQEAVVVGIQNAQKENDTAITSYRDHAQMLACGMDPKRIMTELTGRASGYSKGKGGSMHMFSREKHFYGGHGIVGAQVSLGTGIGFAHKYLENGAVSVVYFGDGAANQGQVYESFNMAKLWGLPVLFIIENNRYAMGTSTNRGCAGEDLYKRAEAYGIQAHKVDGMDVEAVYNAAAKALKFIRDKGEPMLLEMDTYRYRGHSMSDPGNYREKSEVEGIKENSDPITNLKAKLLKQGVVEKKLEEIDKKIKAEMKEVADFATKDPLPDESELYTDILV